MNDSSERDQIDAANMARLREHAKRELRSRMRSVRSALPRSAVAERSAAAIARLWQLPELTSARTIVAFSALQKELDLSALLNEARARGQRVGLPRVVDDYSDLTAPATLVLHEVGSDDELSEGAFGIREPQPSAPTLASNTVDVILVPGLAFDDRGHRIGYGRAFYDRLLPSMPQAFRIGVGYDFQLVPELPDEAHDIAMHCLVTDARVLRI